MTTLSNNTQWEQTNIELATLKKCIIQICELSSDFKKKPDEALVRESLLKWVSERCVKLNYIRIELNRKLYEKSTITQKKVV